MKPDEYRLIVARQMDEDTELLPRVTELARTLRWTLIFHDRDSRMNPAGFLDLTMIRGGVMITAELKSHRGRVRPAQQEWLDGWAAVSRASGGAVRVYLWRPMDLLDGTIATALH